MQVRISMAAIHELSGAIERLGNLLPAWEEAGALLLGSVDRNFAVGGRPRWTSRINAEGDPEMVSGALRASVQALPDHTGVTIRSDLPYSATQQYGRQTGRGAPIPPRPFIVVQREDEKAIAEVLSRFVEGSSVRSVRRSLTASYGVGE